MARIIGGLTTSHVPVLGRVIEERQQQAPKWKPFFDGFDPVQRWLARNKPDIVVEFCIDHGLNFFLDKMPTFAVGAAHDYRNDDEGWGLPQPRAFKGDASLSCTSSTPSWPTNSMSPHARRWCSTTAARSRSTWSGRAGGR